MANAEKARNELEDILSGKEYTVYDTSGGWLLTLWNKVKGWLADFLERLFPAMKTVDSAASVILIAVIAAVVLLLAFAIFYFVRRAQKAKEFRTNKPLQSMRELDWSYRQHLAESEKLEKSGFYTKAARHLFLALLLFFNEKKWLEARIWKTNWEYYDELRTRDKEAAVRFFRLAQFFDEVTYGERKVPEEEYIGYRDDILSWLSSLEESGDEERSWQ